MSSCTKLTSELGLMSVLMEHACQEFSLIVVLYVPATVGSDHGVWGYSVVRRWMMVVVVRVVRGLTVERLYWIVYHPQHRSIAQFIERLDETSSFSARGCTHGICYTVLQWNSVISKNKATVLLSATLSLTLNLKDFFLLFRHGTSTIANVVNFSRLSVRFCLQHAAVM